MRNVLIGLLLLFSFVSSVCNAQPGRDSIRTLIKTLPEDTTKLDVYYAYGLVMEDVDLDSAAFYYKKAEQISDRYNHIRGKIRFASNYSAILNFWGKLDESHQLNSQAHQLAISHNLHPEMGKTATNVGNVHNYRGRYDSAVFYYLKAASLFEKYGEKRYLNTVYQNIGIAFDALEDFDRALEYSLKSIALSEQSGDSIALASALNNAAGSLSSGKLYDSSITFSNRALAISEKINYQFGQLAAHVTAGNANAHLDKHEEAIAHFQASQVAAEKMNYPDGRSSALHGLAASYFKIKEFALAHEHAMEALALSEKRKISTDLLQQYKLLADIKAALGQHTEAYHYLEKFVNLNDSLSGNDVRKIAAGLERKYESARKDQLLAEQALMLEVNENIIETRNMWLMSAVVGVVLLLIIIILFSLYHRQKQNLHRKGMLAMQQNQELIRLKATLDGQHEERQRIAKEMHDEMGSGLTTISFLANTIAEEYPAEKKTIKISEITRQMVNQMNEIVWSLNREQDNLEDLVVYIRHNISDLLDSVSLVCNFRIPDDIPDLTLSGIQRRNVYLVVKEAVHNIIKHAHAEEVSICMEFDKGIRITIADNGKGFSPEVTQRPGHGLKNMQYRMNKIGGAWEMVKTNPVTILITLPL